MDIEIYNAFRKAGVDDADARAAVESINKEIDRRYALHEKQLATRGDVESARHEIAELKAEMVKWFVGTVVAVGGITAALLKLLH